MEELPHEENTKSLFDNWADRGYGQVMARDHEELIENLFAMVPPSGNHVLDIGCGVGEALGTASSFQDVSLAGIDISEKMIQIAKGALPNADLKVGSVLDLPWDQNTFDLIFSIEAIYFVHDIRKALQEIRRCLREGGRFFAVNEYYEENFGSSTWASQLPMKLIRLSENEWIEVFREAGFKSISTARIKRQKSLSKAEFEPSPFFPNYGMYLNYIYEGALCISGTK